MPRTFWNESSPPPNLSLTSNMAQTRLKSFPVVTGSHRFLRYKLPTLLFSSQPNPSLPFVLCCRLQLLLTDLNKFRKYNSSKLRDLLRIIRNKAHHYRDLPQELQQLLGGVPDGYLQYFTQRFPKLFSYTYYFIKEHCETDHKLQQYFSLSDS